MHEDELTRLVEEAGERQGELRGLVSEGGVIMGATRGAIVREKCARQREALRRNPDDPRHGTRTGYTYGCKCAACKEAARLYMKKRKETRR